MFPLNTKSEFSRLKDIHYLDHIGAGVYADSQIDDVAEYLKNNLLGNPHSSSLSSKYCHDAIDQIRFRILEHFCTNDEEYSVIFTSGTTGALKNIVEWFDWGGTELDQPNGQFVYLRSNHTSVLGLREIAAQQNAKIHCLENSDAFIRFKKPTPPVTNEPRRGHALFVYSAMCNFNGCKYPLKWIEKLHNGALDDFIEKGNHKKSPFQWFCLLDAAAFVPTNKLDLSIHKADFVAFSFYKIFGYPTGLGAILVRNSVEKALKKTYYGGGTLLLALSDERNYVPRHTLHEWCEDGTTNYLSILSLRHGFDTLKRLGGEIDTITARVFHLTRYLHDKLMELHHSNGNPVVKIYRDTDYSDALTQGGIINFNLLKYTGEYVGYLEVLHVANSYGIHLRTGCFCNPGACQRHLQMTNKKLLENYQRGHTCADNIDLIDGYPTGSVRVSFGYMSIEEDADFLIKMIIECFVVQPAVIKIPEQWPQQSRLLMSKFEPLIAENNNFPPDLSHDTDITRVNSLMPELIGSSYVNRTAKLANIFIYPIKSCGAYKVPGSWPLTKTGLKYDRKWMIISIDGVVVTQKQMPKMCLIVPHIDEERGVMTLQFREDEDSKSVINVSIEETNQQMKIVSISQSKVCEDKVKVVDCGDDVAKWLEIRLNKRGIRLVKLFSRSKNLSLSNQAQYLLITKSSVRWLLEQSSNLVDIELDSMIQRFRSNFVITSDFAPLEELQWSQVKIGQLLFEVEGPCSRCQMICIDQSSGEKKREPLTTLSSALNGKLKFGIYLRHKEANISTFLSNDDVVMPFRK